MPRTHLSRVKQIAHYEECDQSDLGDNDILSAFHGILTCFAECYCSVLHWLHDPIRPHEHPLSISILDNSKAWSHSALLSSTIHRAPRFHLSHRSDRSVSTFCLQYRERKHAIDNLQGSAVLLHVTRGRQGCRHRVASWCLWTWLRQKNRGRMVGDGSLGLFVHALFWLIDDPVENNQRDSE